MWLRNVASANDLTIVARLGQTTRVFSDPAQFVEGDWWRILLLRNDVVKSQEIDWPRVEAVSVGCIDITPGVLGLRSSQTILTMTEIAAKGERDGPLPWAAFAEFKRVVWSQSTSPVIGYDSPAREKFGVYKDIRSTPEAVKLYIQGVMWKQGLDFRTEFSPEPV